MEDMQVATKHKKKQPVRIVSPEWIVDPSVIVPIRTGASLSVSCIKEATRSSSPVNLISNDDPLRKDFLC